MKKLSRKYYTSFRLLIRLESKRMDETTNKRFTFIADPNNLPVEFYEKQPTILKGFFILKIITKR